MHKSKSESTFSHRVSRQVSVAETQRRPRQSWGGGLTCRVAGKPLLSMCSKVICQLSCSSRQSFKVIAHTLLHPRSFFGHSLGMAPLCLSLLLPAPSLSPSLPVSLALYFTPLQLLPQFLSLIFFCKCCFSPPVLALSVSCTPSAILTN